MMDADIAEALLDDALQPGFLPDVSTLVGRLTVAGESASSNFPSELSQPRLISKKHANRLTSGALLALRCCRLLSLFMTYGRTEGLSPHDVNHVAAPNEEQH